jgi:dTDP-4-amino-4,6-dideoxygalactose transaminase
MSLANARGIKVLEDCAQSHGATYDGRPVGSFGHAAAFSFCQDKIITTGGEGGLLATNEEQLWSSGWAFKDHGKSYAAVYERQHPPGFRWLHDSFGTNWRMTELQAAIGCIQLSKLPQWSKQRRANAQVLADTLSAVDGLRIPRPTTQAEHAYYRFYAYVDTARLRSNWSRDRIVAEVSARGIPCFSGSCSEVYREKAFEGTSFAPPAALPVARELGETSLALLVHPTLNAEHMARTAEAVNAVLASALT